jgi:tetratricopeptide (TPR) repeat protein
MKSVGKNLSWAIYPAIIALGFALYANTFEAPFLFDDRAFITENPKIKIESLGQIGKITALLEEDRPIMHLSLALNYYIHRFRLPGYHILNICLHIACGVLVYLFLLQLLMNTRYREKRTSIATMAALLFTAHPIQTQAVTYVIQRGTSLATFFYLLSILLFIHGRERKRVTYYVFSLVAGILALASKQIAVTLPLIILLYDFYFIRDGDISEARTMLPFYLLLLLLPFVLAIAYTKFDLLGWLKVQYQKRPFSPYQRVLTEFRVVCHYLTLLIFPHLGRLNIDHHIPLSLSPWNPPATFFAGSVLLVLVKIGWDLARKRPVVSFFIFWFLVNLILESSILGLELIFEHRLYLPSIAFFSLAGLLVFGPVSQMKHKIWPVVVIVLALYGWGTILRNRVWGTELTLWQDAAEKSPNKPRVLYNLGHALADQGRYEEALSAYQAAVRYKPDIAAYYNNLGSVYGKLGRHQEAFASYRQGLRLNPNSPRLYNNLGNAYKNLEQYEEAIAAYNKALTLQPDYYQALSNLGVVYYQQEKFDAAIDLYEQVLLEQPQFSKAYLNLALAYKKQKMYEKAIDSLDRGILIDSGDANVFFLRGKLHLENNSPQKALADFRQSSHFNPDSWEIRNTLGEFYKNSGDLANAAVELEAAVRLKPDHFTANFNLAMVYKNLKQYAKAQSIFFSLMGKNPDVVSIYYNLGNMYVERGDYTEAIRWFEKALQIDPESREFAHNLALARLKSGDLTGAEDDLLNITQKFPDYLLAQENLAFLYLQMKEPLKAVSIFEAMLESDPHQAHTLNRLGMILYKKMGQKEKALDYFRRSIEEAPDQPEAKEIKSLISELEQNL